VSLATWLLRGMLQRDGEIGSLYGASELAQWLHVLPRLRCGAAADGARGYIVGTVVSDEELVVSPLTGARCVMARISCERIQRDQSTGEYVSNDIEVACGFRVRDDTGEAWVDPGLVRLFVEPVASVSLPEHHIDVASLASRDRSADGTLLGAELYRYDERRIVAGDAIVLVGQMRHVVTPGAGAAGYRESGRRAEFLCANDAMFLYAGAASLAP
jgi:hypothetical protein